MPELGGPTNQSGTLYQNSIAALYLGRLCDTSCRPDAERVIAVRVEAPGAVDDTVIAFADDHQTYVQAKENIRKSDRPWSKLWPAFAEQYRCAGFRRGHDRLLLHLGEPHDEHHQLCEVSQRANTSPTYAEWWERLTNAQQSLVNAIKPLLPPELLNNGDLLAFFAHIDVEIFSLRQIERDLLPYWMPPSNQSPKQLFRLLRDRVGGEARRRGSFSAEVLRGQLAAEGGVQFKDPPDLEELCTAVRGCGALLRQHKHTIASTGRHLRRAVGDDITAWASGDDEGRVALLLDQAGMGKTVVMRDVLCALESAGVTVLAIKADQQLSGVTSHDELCARLRLPDTVERTVGRLAASGPIVVLIDQIDALSLSLARDQRTLDVVLELVARLRLIPGVRIVLSCRTFDRNTDPKLKRLEVGRQFPLEALSDDEVTDILRDIDIDPEALSPATWELLRVPLHLDLFGRVVEQDSSRPSDRRSLGGLASLQDLYALVWTDIVRKPELGAPPAAEREAVLRVLTERMDREQRTAVPQSTLSASDVAHLQGAADWLASAGILIPSATEWSFLHQTFFDYCYARQFVEGGGRLAAKILAGDQGLFARPQLTQVLVYLRANDTRAYLRELQALFQATGLRFHLRDLLLRWFGALPEPTDNEWVVAQRLLLDPDQRARLLWAMHGNAGWFTRLKGQPLQDLLVLDDQTLDATIMPYLMSLCDVAQADVARIVAPFLEQGEQWRNRVAWLLARISEWRAVEAVDLFERLLYLVPMSDSVRLYALEEIAHNHPEAGCRLIRLLLDRALDTFLTQRDTPGDQPTITFYSGLEVPSVRILGNALESVQQTAPKLLVDTLLPWIERVVALLGETVADTIYYGDDPLAHSWHSGISGASSGMLPAFTTALIELARSDPTEFQAVAARLAALPNMTPQQVLARVYRAVPHTYADEAAQFLLADRRRLALGEQEQYDSRQMLAAIYPFLSGSRRAELEAYILDYAPIRKYRGAKGLRSWRLEQLYFLQAIPPMLLTARAVDRLRELVRKFPGVMASASPSLIQGGMIVSPIPRDRAARMSDTAWLRAMRKYSGAVTHNEFLKGGAYELAGVLLREVQEHPERFYRLALRIPHDTEEAYVGAFLNGLAESAAPAERLFEVVRRFASHPGHMLGRTVAWALEKRAAAGLPDDLLDLLEGRVRDRPGDEESGDRDPYSRYLNSNRGAALRTLMRGLEHQETVKARERQWALIEFATTDPSTVLRAGAIEELLYLLHLDRAWAVALFERLMAGHPALLHIHWTREFLYHGLYHYYLRMRPYIRALMDDTDEACQQQGAELACIAAVSPRALDAPADLADARQLADEALAGPAPWRRGAAHVYAHNITNAATEALAALRQLLSDEDREVRRFVSEMFASLRGDHIFTLRDFFETYAGSRALDDGTGRFAEYLWEHGLLDPPWALMVVERILEHERQRGDAGHFSGSDELVRLVLRVYNDPTSDNALRTHAMDIFDSLMERFTSDAQQALREWDRH